MKVLIPLDGSDLAEHALAYVEQIAHQPAATLQVALLRVNTILPNEAAGSGLSYVPYFTDDMVAEDERAAQEYLHGMARRLIAPGITVSTIVSTGLPATTIIDAAREYSVDLIVMASHGRTGLSRVALGSVAASVVKEAHVPVLIVRAATAAFPPKERTEPFTVLVPLDGTPLAESGVLAALPLARIFGGALRLFEVLSNEVESSDQRQQRWDTAYGYLEKIAMQIRQQGVTVHLAIAWGDAAEQIALEAERYQTDLIALATHGRVGFDRLINGSVAEAVLKDSPVPVLVTHPVPLAHSVPASVSQA